MGTQYHITLIGAGLDKSTDLLQIEIEKNLQYYNSIFSTYIESSELSKLNNQNPGTPFHASEDLYVVIRQALELSVVSDGLYDITAGPLIDLWGFGKQKYPDKKPDDNEIQVALDRVGYQYLQLGEDNLIVKNKNIEIDLSSIAKGYVVDRISDLIMNSGIQNHLVEIGGEVMVKGKNPNGKKWRLGIEKPLPGSLQSNDRVIQAVTLTDMGLATSGDYRNFYILENKKYSHTINAKNGYPVTHQLASVTVVMDNVAMADAWATTLNVLGPERGLSVAEQNHIAAFFVKYKGSSTVYFYTNAMEHYLDD